MFIYQAKTDLYSGWGIAASSEYPPYRSVRHVIDNAITSGGVSFIWVFPQVIVHKV